MYTYYFTFAPEFVSSNYVKYNEDCSMLKSVFPSSMSNQIYDDCSQRQGTGVSPTLWVCDGNKTNCQTINTNSNSKSDSVSNNSKVLMNNSDGNEKFCTLSSSLPSLPPNNATTPYIISWDGSTTATPSPWCTINALF